MRLDIYITKHHQLQSRNKASELIKSGKVLVDTKVITKPSFDIEGSENIEIQEKDFYVSRSAYKLKYFVEEHHIQCENKSAVDIGSSTGGFTQILLEKGVNSLTCVDVGSNQLHPTLKQNPKITIAENTDIRKFTTPQPFDITTCDVSFISILYILDDIHRVSKKEIIILYKPQFEVGKEIKRDSNGVVKDTSAIQKERENFLLHTQKLGWNLLKTDHSKLQGKSGNQEELFYFIK